MREFLLSRRTRRFQLGLHSTWSYACMFQDMRIIDTRVSIILPRPMPDTHARAHGGEKLIRMQSRRKHVQLHRVIFLSPFISDKSPWMMTRSSGETVREMRLDTSIHVDRNSESCTKRTWSTRARVITKRQRFLPFRAQLSSFECSVSASTRSGCAYTCNNFFYREWRRVVSMISRARESYARESHWHRIMYRMHVNTRIGRIEGTYR